jgi:D-alanyl-D-alanine carboxypeptidase (penicillin-binding protein 5/6)
VALFLALLAPALGASEFSWKVPRDFASAILMEAETGQVLWESRADAPRSPASTTKLMVTLIVMEEVAAGRVSLADSVRISRRARRMGGSQVYLAEGEVFTLEDLMKATLVASANDAAVAVAEYVGGSVEAFVERMNRRARSLGLRGTHFANVHGLDDDPARRNVTTARDLAILARELLRYPKVLEWTSLRAAPFRGGRFMLYATNRLLGRIEGLDGLKTGFTSRAGFCLVATAQRRGMRLIAVVLGSRTSRGRFRCARHLLDVGFARFRKVDLYVEGQPLGIEVPVDGGVAPEVPLLAGRSLSLVLPKEQIPHLRETTRVVQSAEPPVRKGAPLGYRDVWLAGRRVASIPAVAARDVEAAGFVQRLLQGLGWTRSPARGSRER